MKKLFFLIFTLQLLVASEIKIDLKEFDSIKNVSPLSVTVHSSDDYFAIFDNSDDLLKDFELKIINGVLKIAHKDRSWWKFWKKFSLRSASLKIFVPLKDIKSIHNYGVGDIQTVDGIESEALSIHQFGTGKISVASLTSNELDVKLSGTGEIEIENQSKIGIAKINLSGTGNIDMLKSYAKSIDVKISGTGNVKLNVEDSLKGNINGTGKIYYIGNPKISFKSNGTGSLQPYKNQSL